MIPEILDGWTLPLIEALLHQGVFESDRFDFKEMLPPSKDEGGKLRLTKTCAAFANSSGGFLIFGVKDDTGLSVSQRLVGIDPGEDLPNRFGNFPAMAEPSVDWAFRNPPIRLATGRLIHVVQVPTNARRPHAILHEERWWFCQRTSKGTETMSFDEFRELFIDATRRRSELAWLRSEMERIDGIQHFCLPNLLAFAVSAAEVGGPPSNRTVCRGRFAFITGSENVTMNFIPGVAVVPQNSATLTTGCESGRRLKAGMAGTADCRRT